MCPLCLFIGDTNLNFDAKEFLQSLFGMLVSKDLPPDWVEDYEERAAILEFDGGLEELEEFLESLAILSVSLVTCSVSPVLALRSSATCFSKAAIRWSR